MWLQLANCVSYSLTSLAFILTTVVELPNFISNFTQSLQTHNYTVYNLCCCHMILSWWRNTIFTLLTFTNLQSGVHPHLAMPWTICTLYVWVFRWCFTWFCFLFTGMRWVPANTQREWPCLSHWVKTTLKYRRCQAFQWKELWALHIYIFPLVL